MIHALIAEHCSDLPVVVCCRVMGVATSGFCQRQAHSLTDHELNEAYATNTVRGIWTMSRRAYGSPRIRRELQLGLGRQCPKTQAERWMRACGAVGIHYPKNHRGCTRPDGTDPDPELVNQRFDPDDPDRLWVVDVTEYRTDEGRVYLATVVDVWSRRVAGRLATRRIRAALVADALQMATYGAIYPSLLFDNRLRSAGLLGSMGTIGECFDDSFPAAFFSSLQRKLLDQHHWATCD